MPKTSWQQKRSPKLREGVYNTNATATATANYFDTRSFSFQNEKTPGGGLMDRKKSDDGTAARQ
jgi:hypothetical protein